ncbi:MAG: hypothetical protein AB7J40_05040 [Candidatus Altimarinota bacterium]
MSLVDKPFKEAIRELPTKKLSWWADRRIKKMLRYRAAELEGRSLWLWGFAKQLVAVPVAFAVFVTALGGYAYSSPTVVRGDMLYAMKTTVEDYRYPREGTSEDRITYHLWLSERRYDEVDEILRRLGKEPLVLIPAARASNGVEEGLSELDQILLETLQSATQHVDYAFLISDEIREVERVKVVTTQIQQTLEKQKTFLEKATPVLKEVKLRERKKARVKRERPVQETVVPSESIPETTEPIVETVPPVNEVEEVPAVESTQPVASEPVEEPVISSGEPVTEPVEEPLMVEVFEEDEEDELEDVGAFLEDRFSFQQELLKRFDDAIGEADLAGMKVVRLTVHVKPLQQEVDPSEDLFREALVVHYERSQQLLQSELDELDQELIVSEESEDVPQEDPETAIAEVPEAAEESVPSPQIVEQTPEEDISSIAVEPKQEPVAVVTEPEPVATEPVLESTPVVSTETPVSISTPEPVPIEKEVQEKESKEGSEMEVKEELPVALPQEEVLRSLLAPTSVPSKAPDVVPPPPENLVLPVPGEAKVLPAVEPEKPKTECELKAEAFCANSEQKNCTEKAVQECEERLKKEREKKEKERQIQEKTERAKQELQEIQLKMEQLRMNFKNSAPEIQKVPEELKAGMFRQQSGLKVKDESVLENVRR